MIDLHNYTMDDNIASLSVSASPPQITQSFDQVIHFLFGAFFGDGDEQGVCILRIPPSQGQTGKESFMLRP
ncbi:MAG: hypothetical protein WBH86_06695, partial [Thermogutta sp.]